MKSTHWIRFMSAIFKLFIYSAIIIGTYAFAEITDPQHHRLVFYLDPDLASGLTDEELKARLTLYAEDINTIFSKQTVRRFDFDPDTDIFLVTEDPYSSTYPGSGCEFPVSGYEVWIHARLTDSPGYGTYGGYGSFDSTGAGVAAGLYWDAVHDRSALVDGSSELAQYWRQIDHIVHEFCHVFGAGNSEYYSLTMVDDSTLTDPVVHIDASDFFSDPYWSEHPDFRADPLLGNIWQNDRVGSPTSYADLMDTIRFADVTVAILNDSLRGCIEEYLPDLSQTRVYVVDQGTDLPIPNTPIKIWNVRSSSPYTVELIVDDTTDALGMYEFSWDGTYSSFDNLMIIKVYPENYDSQARWFSIFDAQIEKLVNNNSVPEIYIRSTSLVVSASEEEASLPRKFILKQNYPNPFNPKTTIEYSIPRAGHVRLEIYNILGQKIETLVDGYRRANDYSIDFDAESLPSGIYFYRLSNNGFSDMKKLVVLK